MTAIVLEIPERVQVLSKRSCNRKKLLHKTIAKQSAGLLSPVPQGTSTILLPNLSPHLREHSERGGRKIIRPEEW